MEVSSSQDLLALASEEDGQNLGRAIARNEAILTEKPLADVIARMARVLSVMREAVSKGKKGDRLSTGGLVGGEARLLSDAIEGGRCLSGETIAKAAMMALATSEVNASMGRIVAAPTAGSCGVLPGSVLSVAEGLKSTDEQIVDALFVAAGIGLIISRNATLSGAEGGCQAECGTAAAMAAAACVSLAGGSPSQCIEAAALALKNEMGLVCDPVGGLVEVPCVKRNGLKAAEAIVAADMALAGIKSVIPFDEVVSAVRSVGRAMPQSLKETALGGLAVTPTGKRLASRAGVISR
jgi:L-serine dehydratase